MDAAAGLPESPSDLARVLSVAVKAADLGVWQWNLLTNEFEYSERAKEIFGFPARAAVTRQQIIDVLHPGDHAVAKEQAARGLDPTLEKREPYLYRIYRENDKQMRWIQAFGEPAFEAVDGSLTPVSYIGTLQDVTEQVAAREQLVRQEARLRLAIEASGIAVWELNLSDGSISHSPELNRLYGFPPDARPTPDELRSRYAPGERERLEKEGAEIRARGGTSIQSEIRNMWPDGTEKWLALRAQLAPGDSPQDGRVIGVVVDVTEQKKREEQLALLVAEFQHRLKNSFAVTQSIVNQTLREEGLSDQARSKLFARLQAMSNAHDLLATGKWEGASLQAVLTRVLLTFEAEQSERTGVQGADLALAPKAALSFSLMFHELFTNASKYGSLSNECGRIAIDIALDENREQPALVLNWREYGGPTIGDVARIGFGTRLIDRIFSAEYSSEITREFRPEGLEFSMVVPLSKVSPPAAPRH